jgi:HD-like signal output (HDOD) protein
MGLALAFLQDTCPSGGVFSMDLAADTLGPDGLRAFLLVSVSDFLDEPAAPENFPLEAFWKHGALCRFLAHELASHLQMDYPELAGLAGLLHDIGKYFSEASDPI